MSDDIKEFEAAVEEVEHEDKIAARISELMRSKDEGGEGLDQTAAEDKAYEEAEKYVDFKLRGRTLRAYQPHDGQMAFLLANLGRGQTNDGRFAAIVNIMTECLRGDDKDHFESLLLTGDRRKRLSLKTLEGVFEHLTEKWFQDESPSGGKAL
jgi:hypothetical protein